MADTRVVIWLALQSKRLSKGALKAIENARRDDRGIGISCITFWEIANAVRRRRIELDISVDQLLNEVERRFMVFPIDARVSLYAAALPSDSPNDPADRIILSTAVTNGIPLITADRVIRRSQVVTAIW